ncbi:MAG: hypothetical protein COB54_03670 [Alphaproteobacteria bacterium]|nr:MAG: hypothetical protein COB54_03670 [Alphaproteobacteria bacterium]
MGAAAYAEPAPSPDTAQDAPQETKSLTSTFLSFFSNKPEQKAIGPEVLLLGKPAKENADQYITLSEPDTSLTLEQADKKLSVQQSFAVKPSLVFNMGNSGFSSATPSGFSSMGASSSGNRVTFSYGTEGQRLDTGALGISFGSQFLVEPSSIMSPLYDGAGFNKINNRQVYNLSVDMGYAGFSLGASFSQEKMLYESGLKGFDIGLGYAGRNWGADVKFGEYKRERERLFASTEEFYDTVYALEIGAAYQIHSNIRFTGRFTYYSYGQDSELDQVRSSQVFFLGTNVNF